MLVNINIYKRIDPHNYKILEGISPGACTKKLVNYGRKSFIVQAPEVLQEKYVGGGGFVYLLSFLCTCPSGGSSKCQ
jgi:hypothetical protein